MNATVAVVQMDCALGDVPASLERIEAGARAAASDGADLVVFPECATTGYFVGDRAQALAEPAGGRTNARLAALSAETGAHLAVGVIESLGGRLYDALALFAPSEGLVASYRKVHLFAGEKAVFTPGDEPCVVDTALGRLALTVCYDLMFPEYIRGLVLAGAQLIVNGTDWITNGWQTGQGWSGPTLRALCQVRALENGVHVAMADRVGEEAGFTSLGHSTIAGPTGAVLATLGEGEGRAAAIVSDPTPDLETWRSIATYLPDRRPELYERMRLLG
jgi:predicted amidohydrolase